MAKPTIILAATFALLLIILTASATQTSDNSSGRQGDPSQRKCSIKEPEQYIIRCQFYIQDSIQTKGSIWRNNFPLCCNQLQDLGKECRCVALERTVKRLQDMLKGELHGQQVAQLVDNGRSLPFVCRIPPSEYCEFGKGGKKP